MKRDYKAHFYQSVALLLLLLVGRSSLANLLAVGERFTCAWDGRSSNPLQCWGDNSEGQLTGSEKIFNPFQLGAGVEHGCALYYDAKAFGGRAIACFGDQKERYKQKFIPPEVINPQLLSVGRWHNLVLFEPEPGLTRVACWGRKDSRQCDVPELRNPSAVFASRQKGFNYSCALHQGGKFIRCWGDINLEVAASNFPGVESGLPLVCDDMGPTSVNCWSNRLQSKSPNIVVTADSRNCRLDSTGVNCFNRTLEPDLIPFQFIHPVDVAVAVSHACVLDDTGCQCWGCLPGLTACQKNSNLQFGPSFEQLADAGAFLSTLAQFVYGFDSSFLKEVQELIDENRAYTAYILKSLRPYFMEFGYRHLKDEYVSRAIFTIDRLASNWERTARPLDPAVKTTLALRILASSLKTSVPVLSEKAQRTQQKIVAELGSLVENEKFPETLARVISTFYRSQGSSLYLSGRIVMGEALLAQLTERK